MVCGRDTLGTSPWSIQWDWRSFFNNMLSNLAWWVVLLAGGAVLALLRFYWPLLAEPALYGFVGVTCVAILIFATTGRPIFSKQLPQTTPENVEANVRAWLDSFKISCKKETSPDTYFILLATLNSGNPIGIGRAKAQDRYLSFQARISLSPEHQGPMDRMTPAQIEHTLREITLEFFRTKTNYTLEGPPFRAIVISKALLISARLTEDVFSGILDEMDSAVSMARVVTVMAIERNTGNKIAAKPPTVAEKHRARR
jgi:hypothetical protein